jgi:glycolate oxidase FAD binding subunit
MDRPRWHMSDTMLDLLRRVAGNDAVRREPGGIARVTPTSPDTVAGILGIAHDEGWRVAVEGLGTWRAEDSPADVVVSLRGLDEIREREPLEHLASVDAGVPLERLRRHVLDDGAWLALDPPGRPDRSIGSTVVTATAGPLRLGFGPVREQLLSITVATGDGRVIRSHELGNNGSSDPLGIHVGGFGAFGVVTSCEVKLHPLPRADVTWVAIGPRDVLTSAGRELADQGLPIVAAELFSPALAMESDWLLAVRMLGDPDLIDASAPRLANVGGLVWRELAPDRRSMLWNGAARAVTTVPVTIRLGVLRDGLDDTIDLIIARLGEGMQSAGVVSGAIRWSGVADAEPLRSVRAELAGREIPLTLERAPWRVRRAIGHFGPYRERHAASFDRIRHEFDPADVLVTALDGRQEP